MTLTAVHNPMLMRNFGREQRVGDWVAWMRAQSWSDRTIGERVRTVMRAAAGRDPVRLDLAAVVRFLGQSFSPATRHTYDAHLRSWFRYLIAAGVSDVDPMATLPKPRLPRAEATSLRTEHVSRLLGSRMHARTRTMILLAAYQGLRASEVARVRGVDVDVIGQTLAVRGKGGVRALLPLHPVIAREAQEYGPGWWFVQHVPNRGSAAGGPVLGNSVSRIVGDAMRRAGVPGTCHSLRHWYASEMLRQGADIRVIQQLMRHASLSTTERYLHVDEDARMSAALRLPMAA